METVVRGLILLGFAGAVSGAAAVNVGLNWAMDPDPVLQAPLAREDFHQYDLRKLEILEQTVFHVHERYVDPERLNWERMYGQVLQAIEHEVPSCVFHREPGSAVVSIEIGGFRTVLDQPPIDDEAMFVTALRQVAGLACDPISPTSCMSSSAASATIC